MNRRARTDRAGFTLVEVLVVASVIVLLAIILLPVLSKYRQIIRANITLSTIRSLDIACNAYREDFGAFPPSNNSGSASAYPNWPGAELLPLFLIGYADDPGTKGQPVALTTDDGVDGPGFRVVQRGKVYGPYGNAPKLPIAGGSPRWFLDAFDRPILYYRSADPNAATNTFNFGDNSTGIFVGPNSAAKLDLYARGNINTSPASPYLRKDFLLMSPGYDGEWASQNKTVDATDDVTNLYPNQ